MKKVIVAGSSGMVGQLILQLCLNEKSIEVISLVRQPLNLSHVKLREIVVDEEQFKGVDVVYYCVGVYTGAVPRDLFRMVTVDYPMALAQTIKKHAPKSAFVLLSGQGADRQEKSRMMFAKDKGEVENKLEALLGPLFFACRPGYIYPVQKRKEPNFSYVLSRKLYPVLKLLGKKLSITSEELALAMFLIGLKKPQKTLFENDELREYLTVV